MTPKELKALIALLDDNDATVSREVTDRIIALGSSVIPKLEKSWEESNNSMVQTRIESIIHTIQFQNAKTKLEQWVVSGSKNLIEAATYVAAYHYPSISYQWVEDEIDQLKKSIWLEFNPSLTPLEKIKIVNHFFFNTFGFNSSPVDIFSPDNYFINRVIENKRGGPVCLSIIYSVLSQKLGLPVFCVSLPRNFILVYLNRYAHPGVENPANSRILFYINPFNRGQILGYDDIRNYLERIGTEAKQEYFEPCSNQTSIAQLIASLMIAFQKIENTSKVKDLQQLLNVVVNHELR